MCSLFFFLPPQNDLLSYSFSGSGTLSWDAVAEPANEGTSYSNAPQKAEHLTEGPIQPNVDVWIGDQPCDARATVGIQMSGSQGMGLEYFQDIENRIGLYIRAC
jgi:hypothetical protein